MQARGRRMTQPVRASRIEDRRPAAVCPPCRWVRCLRYPGTGKGRQVRARPTPLSPQLPGTRCPVSPTVHPQRRPRTSGRRQFLRFPVARTGRLHVVVYAENQPVFGCAQDVSDNGLGIVVPCPLASGADVTLRLWSSFGAYSCRCEARIIHATRKPEGCYLVGAQFARPLADQQVFSLSG